MAIHAEEHRLSQRVQRLRLSASQREERVALGRNGRIVGIILIIGALAAGGVTFLVQRAESFEIDTFVATAPSGQVGPTATLQATGYVTARRQATVSAPITGTVTEVLIEEGDHVQAGQVLTRLEDHAQLASLAQAQAQVMVARALLSQSRAQLGQALRDLKRSEDLVARRLVSAQSIEVARTVVETYQAQVQSQRKQVELAQAVERGAEVQLAYTTIRAPFAGVIVDKTAQAGEIVSPMSAGGGFTRTGIGTIVDMSSLEIEIDVNEAYIHRIEPGQRAEAVLDAYPDWKISAHVIAIIPTADRSKATVKVRVGIDERDSRILPDMGARVSFHKRESHAEGGNKVTAAPVKGVLVPSSAIVERKGKSVVFTVADDLAHERGIVLGKPYGDLRLVEGISKGARVVREPPAGLRDKARVWVKAKR